MDLFSINLEIQQFTFKIKKLKHNIKQCTASINDKDYTIEEIENLEKELIKIKNLLKNVDK